MPENFNEEVEPTVEAESTGETIDEQADQQGETNDDQANQQGESDDEQMGQQGETVDNQESVGEPTPGVGIPIDAITTAAKLIKMLPQIKIFLIIGIIAIILIVIAIFSNNKRYDYIAPKCTKMTVSRADADEDDEPLSMEVDEFIISMIYSITRDMKDPDFDLYNALNVTIRTNIQGGTSGYCEYIIRDDPNKLFDFVQISPDSDEYKKIEDDIFVTNQIVMTKNEKYIEAQYDAFCYDDMGFDDEIGEYYILAQQGLKIPVTWAENHVNNEQYLNCPCNKNIGDDICWEEETDYGPDDQESTTYYYIDGGDGKGLSVYGAYYLASEKNYDYFSILELFFGDNIEYSSNDSKYNSSTKSTCNSGDIDVFSTSLSRSQFVSLVQEYLSQFDSEKARLYSENAGEIYDLGQKLGVNPEYIYIIVTKEGKWTGTFDGGQNRKCYNYYGYGVYNGTAWSDWCWDSLLEGVEYMLNFFKRKGSMSGILAVYSSVGTYLANPGTWDDGGCIYLKLPEIYGPNYSRCNSSYRCASSNGGTGCVLTTDAEKQAYIDWQKTQYFVHRKNIFKISEGTCSNSTGDYSGSSGGHTILTERIDNFLTSKGTSLEAFNRKIFDAACDNIKTGEAVAAVASTAVKELGNYNKKFPYSWGGLHGKPSYYGVGANWGAGYGPDCSGFVSWALYNSGFQYYLKGAVDWAKTGIRTNLGDTEAEIGDLIVTKSKGSYDHVVIIVGIDYNSKKYNVVHASGSASGVLFGEISFSDSTRELVKMKSYYNSLPRNEEFINTYCGG